MTAAPSTTARMTSLGAHLMRLKPEVKRPVATGWPLAVAISVEEADAHLAAGGNIGVNLSLSRFIVLDAENFAATSVVTAAGFTVTVIPAKAQANYTRDPEHDKRGGSHTWLRVPEGIDAAALPADKIGIKLAGGGVIDVLAGVRYAVAPPSRLAEAPEYRYAVCQGGPLDPAVYTEHPEADLDVAPMWLFDKAVPCPPGLEPIHGCLAPQSARERVEADAKSQELTDDIDSVPWELWIDGDPRLTPTGEIDGCGCPIWHWQGAENSKSATLHEGCSQGCGAHIWSGSMIGQLELDGDHLSRLDLSAALTGLSRREAAARVGITLGGGEPLAPVLPQHYEQYACAAEAAGQSDRAAQFRHAAAVMRARQTGIPVGTSEPFSEANPAIIGNANSANTTTAAAGSADNAVSGGSAPASGAALQAPETVSKAPNRTVLRFPGRAMADIPEPGDHEIHEYPIPAIPDEVPPVRGARTEWAEVLPPLANRKAHATVKYEWIFSATPGLSQVAAAADSRGVGRWGMLGALLPRVAATIPPTVRLVPADGSVPAGDAPTGQGCSINIYSVLVGPPASGKSVTLAASDSLIPSVHMVPPGTGEGILKIFPRADDDSDDDQPGTGGVGSAGVSDSVLLSSDEIDVFVAEMGRQGTKASGLYRQMWMGGDVGNITSDRERHAMVEAHTYRFGIRLGAQPDAVSPMFDESDRGTPQRFLWLGAQRMIARGNPYPGRLAIAPVYWFDNSAAQGNVSAMIPRLTGPRPPVWIVPPPAAREEMAAELWRSATANPMSPSGGYSEGYAPVDRAAAIADRHANLQQLKICAVLAALDGLAQPQDVHWFAAGAVMAVRRLVIADLVEVADAVRAAAARKRGEEMGIMRAHADVASEQEASDRRWDASAAVSIAVGLLQAANKPITLKSITEEVNTTGVADPRFINNAVKEMAHRGELTLNPDGSTYSFTPEGPPRRENNVVYLRPAVGDSGATPTIGTVS